MKKMITYILIVAIVLILVLVAGWFGCRYFSPSAKVLEYRDFSCPGMTGFTFKYPVFEGWEVKSIDMVKSVPGPVSVCIISFNNDKLTISVSKTSKLGLNTLKDHSDIPTLKSIKNSNGVLYNQLDNPASVQFYTADFGVNIEQNPNYFYRDIFFKTVIESFRLTK
jgi:hypothetical protein